MGNWDVSKPCAELATKTCNKQITSKLENAELARDSRETCNNKQVSCKLVASEDERMTREEIKNIPELVDLMIDKCVLADSRSKVCKKLKKVCDLAIKALEQEPCEDTISRSSIKQKLQEHHDFYVKAYGGFSNLPQNDKSRVDEINACIAMVVNEPSVTPKQRIGWIPFTYRPATDEEKKDFTKRTGYDEEDIDTILNCQLPEDGETVLITDRLGNVEVDTFINDCDECYFECNCDMEDVRAWMPLPKPYEPQTESEE